MNRPAMTIEDPVFPASGGALDVRPRRTFTPRERASLKEKYRIGRLRSEMEQEQSRQGALIMIGIAGIFFEGVLLVSLFPHISILGGAAGLLLMFLTLVVPLIPGEKRRRRIVTQFAATEDVGMIGALVEMLPETVNGSFAYAAEIKPALIRLLPRLTAADAACLHSDHRHRLNLQLLASDATLNLAILQAFEKVGVVSSLPFVEWLACGLGGVGSNAEVREAANRCRDRLLPQMNDDRNVVALIDLLSIHRTYPLALPSYRDAAIRALTHMLPRLQPRDARFIRGRQLRQLVAELNGDDPEFVLAILHVLPQIGAADAIPSVRRLALGKLVARQDTYVREAARVCLEVLEQRAASARNAHLLLRASTPPEPPADNLLRSVVRASPAEPAQLLRSSEQNKVRKV